MTRKTLKLKKGRARRRTQKGARRRTQNGGAIKGLLKVVGGVGKGVLGIGYYSALTLSPLIFYKYISEGDRYDKKWVDYIKCIKSNQKSRCKKTLYRTKEDDATAAALEQKTEVAGESTKKVSSERRRSV